jgi:hypothetical protein
MLSPDYAMKSSLAKVWSHVTGPIVDRDGTELPVSRLDIVLCVVLAVALMVIVAQWFEPKSQRVSTRSMVAGVIAIGVPLLVRERRLIIGAALAIVSVRLWLGVLVVRAGSLLALAIVCSLVGGILLKPYLFRGN